MLLSDAVIVWVSKLENGAMGCSSSTCEPPRGGGRGGGGPGGHGLGSHDEVAAEMYHLETSMKNQPSYQDTSKKSVLKEVQQADIHATFEKPKSEDKVTAQEKVEVFLETVQRTPYVLEMKVQKKRRRDFGPM